MDVLAARTADEVFLYVFAGIGVILITARLLGRVFVRLGQPAVMGEVIAGIVLGPSILGLFPGELDEALFPADIQPALRVVAQLGLVIYLFIVGTELDLRVLGSNRAASITISLTSIGLTFVLGFAAGFVLHGRHDEATKLVGTELESVSVDRLAFALFCGLAICGSAFAILARILDERGLFRTRMGPVLVGCAVVDDLAVWSLAAVVLAIAASSGAAGAPLTLGGLAALVVVLAVVVRPLLRRLIDRWWAPGQPIPPDLLAALIVGMLAAACVTTALGISPILGAFLFGAAIPREGTAALLGEIADRFESLSVLVLLPVFFVVTGLGVDLSTLGGEGLATLALFIVLATTGKLAGAALGARLQGFRGRRAIAVGCLMNTRGLTELALLALGRDLGVLDDTMFTALVTAAVATTLVSGPLLRLVYDDDLIAQDIADAERRRLAASDAYRVLVLVEHPADDGRLVDLGAALAAGETGGEVVLSHIGRLRAHGEIGTGLVAELDAMTTAFESLRALQERATAAGVTAVPLSQFTHDVAGELVAQVARVRPNLVVVTDRDEETDAVVARLRDEARVDVAVAAADPDLGTGPIGFGPGTSSAHVLAAELALRLARGLGRPLHVPDERRPAGHEVLDELAPARPDEADDPPGPAILVSADGRPAEVGAVLVSHPTADTVERRSLAPLRDRLGPDGAASAPESEDTDGVTLT